MNNVINGRYNVKCHVLRRNAMREAVLERKEDVSGGQWRM
jgi:hypothetical protein